MPDLPDELRDRAAGAALESFHGITRHPPYNFDTTTEGYREAWREVVDAVAEVLTEHQTAECTCAGLPQPEGPCAWCDVHGQPSVAWSQGVESGAAQERTLANMELPDLRARAERAEADLAQAQAMVAQLAGWAAFVRPDDDPVLAAAHAFLARSVPSDPATLSENKD